MCCTMEKYIREARPEFFQTELSQQRIEDFEELTEIQQFYDKSTVFITGVTGFLGKILLEKLLRSCPTLSTIYVLVRNKKGKNLHARLEALFDDVLFSKLNSECPKYRHKVVAVGGDCSLPDLGISMQDRQLIIDEVNVIFHVAATVRFDEKLKTAIEINAKAPRELLALAHQMKRLDSFLHVSTAYSHCPYSVIEERFYSMSMDSKKLISVTENLSDKVVNDITPKFLDKWPNTYTFTKAVAEDLVRQDGSDLPIGVFRPAIVVSSYKEPLRGWVDNFYGPTGICVGAATGVLRALHCDENVNANLVPVDMVANCMICMAWEVAAEYRNAVDEKRTYEIPVFNYESSNDNPVTWRRFMQYSWEHGKDIPPNKAIWYYSFTMQKNWALYWLCVLFLHIIPAIVVDAALVCAGKRPKLVQVYKKVHKFSNVISYFTTRNWKFQSDRVHKLIEKLSEKDRALFYCDMRQLDWNDFFRNYVLGLRKYILQDPMETIPEAQKKWKRLYWCHQVLKYVSLLLGLRILWEVLSIIFMKFLM